ncbi:MAG: tetratricopeptide repeat protein [Thermonemataceae bacterium]
MTTLINEKVIGIIICLLSIYSFSLQAQKRATLENSDVKKLVKRMEWTREKAAHFHKEKNADSTLYWAKESIALAQQLRNVEYEASARNFLAHVYIRRSDFKNVLKALEANVQLLKAPAPQPLGNAKPLGKERKDLAGQMNNLGLANLRLGYPDKAEGIFKEAIQLEEQGENRKAELARFYGNLGTLNSQRQHNKEALHCYYKAIALLKETGNEKALGSPYNNLGNVEHKLKNVEKATYYYQKALDIGKRHQVTITQVNALQNLATISWYEQENYKEAKQYIEEALALSQSAGYRDKVANCYYNLGVIARETEDYDQAIEYCKEALARFEEMGVIDKVSSIYYDISMIYLYQENWSQAIHFAQKSRQLAQENNLQFQMLQTAEALRIVYEENEQYEEALKMQQSLTIYRDSIVNQQKVKEVERLRVAFDTKEKESQIQLLSKEKEVQALQLSEQANLAAYNQTQLTLTSKEKALEALAFNQKRLENEARIAQTENEKALQTRLLQATQQQRQLLERDNQLKAATLEQRSLQERNWLLAGGIGLVLLLLGIGWRVNYQRQRIQLAKAKVQRQEVVAQFENLKNQVNPHFLFNSLQTLASLIQEDAQKAQQYTLTFSQLYQSVLQLNNELLIDLKEEFHLCRAYIATQAIRFGEGLQVNWAVDEVDASWQIPPLALQLTLENAIKHNEISEEKPLQISIEVAEQTLIVRNTLQKTLQEVASTQVGTQNIVRRYQLLGKDLPTFEETDTSYTVRLPLC